MCSKWFVALVAAAVGAFAAGQEAPTPPKPADRALDVTMVLLPEKAKGPEPITRSIQLPTAPERRTKPVTPVTPATPAEREPERRPDNVGEGKDTANDARERGRAAGQDVAEQARDNRESAVRARDDRPDRPDKPDKPLPAPPAPPEHPDHP